MSTFAKIMTPRAIVQLTLAILVAPLMPMIISGDWGWPEAWAYAALSMLGFIISRVLAARRHPDLLAERARFLSAQDTKPFDKILAPALALSGVMILAVAGLDRAYGWTPAFPLWVKLSALAVILLGYVLSSWALMENRFFSGTVRIQTERGHRVVNSGPYHWIRHPGYAGGLLAYLLTPALLDSMRAFIPAFIVLVVLVLRTALEDRTLQAELAGYAGYARQTRYRLFPGLW
jgi:protein-S-isoprenylcysteine O-methyltransferase Ste14